MSDTRYQRKLILPTHNPLENNQHHIIKDFLAGNYDYWLSLDNDISLANNPLNLVEYDRDIIGLPCPVWHITGLKGERPYHCNVYDCASDGEVGYKEHKLTPGIQKVDAIGGGCMLISRRVFLDKEMQKGAFIRKLNSDGTVHKGNDISFCERARDRGFEVYTHGDYWCEHIDTIGSTEIIEAFAKFYGN
jgi:GT2 family glycosyltransferase